MRITSESVKSMPLWILHMPRDFVNLPEPSDNSTGDFTFLFLYTRSNPRARVESGFEVVFEEKMPDDFGWRRIHCFKRRHSPSLA